MGRCGQSERFCDEHFSSMCKGPGLIPSISKETEGQHLKVSAFLFLISPQLFLCPPDKLACVLCVSPTFQLAWRALRPTPQVTLKAGLLMAAENSGRQSLKNGSGLRGKHSRPWDPLLIWGRGEKEVKDEMGEEMEEEGGGHRGGHRGGDGEGEDGGEDEEEEG